MTWQRRSLASMIHWLPLLAAAALLPQAPQLRPVHAPRAAVGSLRAVATGPGAGTLDPAALLRRLGSADARKLQRELVELAVAQDPKVVRVVGYSQADVHPRISVQQAQ